MKKLRKIVCIGMLFLILASCSKKGESPTQEVSSNQIEPFTQDNPHTQEVISIIRHPRAVDFNAEFPEYYVPKRDQLPDINEFGYDLRSTDLTSLDLSKEYDKLINASYDSKTIWPKLLPTNFDPKKILELYKNPGLNVRSLHEKGITGQGVGIGIIDFTLLVDHIEYKDQLKYYNEHRVAEDEPASLHGGAVASIAVGKSIGVAPESNLYYIADNHENDEYANGIVAGDIIELLDLNKTLPYKNRIRVISISWGFDASIKEGHDIIEAAFARAKKEGVFVISTSISDRENKEFFGLNKIPLSDPDDYNTYTENVFSNDNKKYKISVPMSFRTVAYPTGDDEYAVFGQGGLSWATPYVAGLYALACQVYPEVTIDQFWEVAYGTSRSSYGIYNGESYVANYIVNPVAMIEKIRSMSK